MLGPVYHLIQLSLLFSMGCRLKRLWQNAFPVLTLEQVYGAITYYLAHRADIDRYLQQADAEFDALRQATRNADPQFHAKLMQARRQSQMTQI